MNKVNDNPFVEYSGPFEARYLAFLETIAALRPGLHRYCSRMTGSVMDGEDVVQEALFEAYRKLDKIRRQPSSEAVAISDRTQPFHRFPAAQRRARRS